MKFKEIEVSGFKSFADKTNFYFEKGLTGIVGPNGCGKSNVLEALRWVMGETSAKSLRGSGMEDVIFNGTSNRPSKNICEVSIKLENNDDVLQFKGIPEIEIKRKLEKDKGSKYYINGKEVKKPNFYNFFDTLHNTETKQYFGEDFGFCQRWRDMGGKVYLYIMDYITHVGEHQFCGRFFDNLKLVDDSKKIK